MNPSKWSISAIRNYQSHRSATERRPADHDKLDWWFHATLPGALKIVGMHIVGHLPLAYRVQNEIAWP